MRRSVVRTGQRFPGRARRTNIYLYTSSSSSPKSRDLLLLLPESYGTLSSRAPCMHTRPFKHRVLRCNTYVVVFLFYFFFLACNMCCSATAAAVTISCRVYWTITVRRHRILRRHHRRCPLVCRKSARNETRTSRFFCTGIIRSSKDKSDIAPVRDLQCTRIGVTINSKARRETRRSEFISNDKFTLKNNKICFYPMPT